MDDERLHAHLRDQDGLIARRQVLACGGDDSLVERKLRRREWCRVHPGGYVDHTGPLSWGQRAWAAVLYYWPAALSHESSLRVHGLRTADGPPDAVIQVAVDRNRRVGRLDGVQVRRVTALDDLIQPNRSPARVRLERSLRRT